MGFHVRPKTVVEVALNEIQRSPHYPSGLLFGSPGSSGFEMTKGPGDVDSYERLKDLYAKQFERKGRARTISARAASPWAHLPECTSK